MNFELNTINEQKFIIHNSQLIIQKIISYHFLPHQDKKIC